MKPFSVTGIPLRGRNLVDASAGTGKTYAIATLFVRLLLETELAPNQLLVVTFTEAATAELRDRIRARVRDAARLARPSDRGEPPEADPTLLELVVRTGDPERAAERLYGALAEFDNIEISTIHGFCQRVLMDRSFESDVTWGSQLYGDARPLIDELILDFWACHAGPAAPELLAYLRSEGSRFSIDQARRLAYTVARTPDVHLLPEEPPPEPAPDFARFRRELERARATFARHDMEALIAASAVNKRSYNRRNTQRWVSEVRTYLEADPELFLAPPEQLERFCTRRLKEAGGAALAGHELFLACDTLLAEHQVLDRALAAEALRFKLALLDYVRRELPRRTRALRQLSFDDLLQRLHAALYSASGEALADQIRKRYPAALIDEFQDTDPLQLQIFERIYGAPSTSLFLIGDPKQAIYSFRGADVFSYVQAARRTQAERHYTMTTNYRSDPSMVAAVNHLFSSSARPFLLSEIGFQSAAPRPGSSDVLIAADGSAASGLEILLPPLDEKGLATDWAFTSLPQLVASEITNLLQSGYRCRGEPVVPGDIAVLTRTNDQAFQIQAALRQRGVASVVLGDKSVYASSEAADLERVLRAVVEPTNNRLVRAALTTDLVGLTGTELHALDESDGEWESWLAAFHEFSAIWSQTGFVQMMRVLMSRCRVPERWLQLGDGERRMTNLLQLVELLHAAGMQGHLGPSGIFAFLARARRREVLGMEAEAAQIRLESDSAAVKITTMHKSKGLEYPIVYCPYSWNGTLLFPNDELAPKLHLPDGRLVIDIGSSEKQDNLVQARWEQFAENMRLLYVALTRARHRCTIVWGRIGRNFATSPLGYLLHSPPTGAAAPDVPSIQAHLQGLSDEELVSDIDAHAHDAPITWRFAEPGDTSTYASDAQPERPLIARRPRFAIADRFRTSSFSALSSHAPSPEQALVRAEERSRDHDASAAAFDPEDVALPPASAPLQIRLADFPRGAKAGSFFHDVLEHYDFASPRPDALSKLVESRLLSYQYPVADWRERVTEQICAVLDTPLAGPGLRPVRLGEVPLARRLTELEFRLPVASRSDARGHAVAARDIARIFREHPSPALSPRYADAVSELGFVPLEGFIRGYIDLVFEHDGSYFLADYKANHLGETTDSYGPGAIEAAMLGGHYYLQYHLYALALHRYLGQRIQGYDFARHFGGVFYLFIKGMGPELGTSGIFFEKPPLARLTALSELCERGVRHG